MISRVQDKNNTRNLSFTDSGKLLDMGTLNYIDTTAGAPTFKVAPQRLFFPTGGWIEILDRNGTFDVNPVTIDFSDFDFFEGVFGQNFVCNEKNVRYRFRHVSDLFGWTVDKVYPFETRVNALVTDVLDGHPISDNNGDLVKKVLGT